ncbi:nicotinate dehydrogenase subunit B [Hydrogenophaga palleronii]|uniref:Nicotinate dehydrogenase subunit B n=1 Tax=Hydrogenophaga palleronii TaxID=65655 RepID=A0ABU1WLF2_9BURK|nr:molybdopterin cofactor-binding domain-containing protein [Hydrogenophaga palleronii]MDR7149872.1 nicotinate dehydrogenase subunit B [Hydrogenophaga palleronii]
MSASDRLATLRTRSDFLQASGVLLITRDPPPPPPPTPGQPAAVPGNPAEGVEVLLSVWDDGEVVALHGHVDLGTGIQTALAQIVAEELDVGMARVRMVLGDTARAPNQGATIASASIQIHAVPLRLAAAQARAFLVARAAQHLQCEAAALVVNDGVVQVAGDASRRVSYGDLLNTQRFELTLDTSTPLKPPSDYRIVGTSTARVDIPAKATGELSFVHDMRVPGMLHGRVVRPPYAGADHGDFIGNTLESVDESSIAHIPGVRAVVVIRDFVGVVAEREEHADQAARELRVVWKDWPGLPRTDDIEQALRANPSTRRVLVDEGDVEAATASVEQRLSRTYLWPYQMHASIGPSCALADWQGERLTVWAGTQNPHVLRLDLSRLTGLADVAIEVVRMEAAGCYGRNGADDVAADAALLSRAVGAPVRVQLTREQEHLWEPKGAAQWMTVDGGLQADGSAAYDFTTSYPSNGAPTLALLLTRTIEPTAQAYEMGDRTARPPYDYPALRVAIHDMPPILRASWLRGVSALPNSFAHESYVDELATAAGEDPVAFRLRLLKDPRAHELLEATARRAGWRPHTEPQQQGRTGDILHGQGVAYARYVHSKWPGFGAAWAAWVADVDVNQKTGEVHVKRVVVGHDAGLMINPAGVQHQIHGNVIQTTSRALKERVSTEPARNTVANAEWGSYPILNFREVPVIDVMMMPRPDQPPLGAGESSSVPGTAAIANAIFDATGVRFRQPPFTPEVVRAALNPLPAPQQAAPAPAPERQVPASAPWPRRRSGWARVLALAAGSLGVGAALLGWRPAIAPVAPASASVYTAATIERGRVLAAAGDCVVCHTTPGGVPNAGGRGMATPFGTIYTTNLTPDPDTGIGRWSFSAFQRAMREGVSRDGRHLYPAFPYTAFARLSDDDLTALYAYLMSQPAVAAAPPSTDLAFPFNQRALMAGWNALFHDPRPYQPDPSQTVEWNRGAYLVNGVGHCGACHTPRNGLGAEQGGRAYLSGAVVDGWEAPALTALNKAPVPWSIDALYRYLRSGHSRHHGMATGPMAPVVQQLAALPDDDIRAMATYLGAFQAPVNDEAAEAQAVVARAAAQAPSLLGNGQRMFDGACAACHHDGDGPRLLGTQSPLALNTNLHSERPDNVLRAILEGVRDPAGPELGFMPAFRHALSDAQIAELASYMRQRFAPGQPPWQGLAQAVARVRATPSDP